MSLRVDSKIIRSQEGKVKYWLPPGGGREHYHLAVWIEGTEDELDEIENVQYVLHPSFARPHRNSSDRSNHFGIRFWTWGMFNIQVRINFKDGRVKEVDFYLSYDLPEHSYDYSLVR